VTAIIATSTRGAGQTMALASAISRVLLGSILDRVAPKVGIDVARVSRGGASG
jgi:hypothetical protein